MAPFLVIAAGVAAFGDWIAVWRSSRAAEYALKPLTLLLLIAAAVALRDQAPMLVWAFTVAALAFSLVGDIFLMRPGRFFLGGLGAFLVAHVAYVGSFTATHPPLRVLALASLGVAAAGPPVYLRLRRGMAERGASRMALPVGLYVAAIGAMAASAIATLGDPRWTAPRSALAIAGAALFMTSDGLIGWTRFVRPLSWAPVAIMVTYHLAQGALAWSLLGWAAAPV